MERKVMEISHIAPKKLLVTSCLSWYLPRAERSHRHRVVLVPPRVPPRCHRLCHMGFSRFPIQWLQPGESPSS